MHNPTSRNTDLPANHRAGLDTRRFGAIFSVKAPEAVPVDGSDTTCEEQNNSDFITALDENPSATTQVASLSGLGERSTLSAAQHVIPCRHVIHGSDHTHELDCGITEKELPQIPEDQRSMYTLGTSADMQSTMDMMWKPKPKIHMRRADQLALMQAQTQALAMMGNAGLKPTNKIQCRRRGCADILPNVQALKYHLHIHNIADSAGEYSDDFPPAPCKISVAECGISVPKGLKRNHSRSKSSHGTLHKSPALPRKLSIGALPPSLFSPRETIPEASQIPSFTTVAKTLTPRCSPNKPTVCLPVRNDETPSRHISIPSCDWRKRKESTTISVGTEHHSNIAMVLSPPSSSITHSRQLFASGAHGLLRDDESDNCTPISNESAQLVPKQFARSRSPIRALNPSRGVGSILNGIKRILSIGNVIDQ